MSLLEVKDLHKDFSGLKVLTGINLSIEEGERHSIIGPNGAGKSTLFNIIAGKYRPSLGRIFFDGEDITGLSPYKISRRGLARSFQIINIFPVMNVYQNVRNAILSKEKIRLNTFLRLEKMDRIDQETINVLESLGLIGIKDVLAGELSYGQQRALEIGIALATDPKLILLDEPTAGMTKEETKETVALIQNVTKGKTLVVIEHDMDVVFSIAHRITVLYYGEILASGTPDEIRNSEKVREAYLGKKADARSF
ncbi:MAG TPA: ABC transporter ATP-binding protein [Thermodesulfobacteriota bacterium]|nr:ABC transporter ATP-binding protein [Thermodesulfobacteriota bacterium]